MIPNRRCGGSSEVGEATARTLNLAVVFDPRNEGCPRWRQGLWPTSAWKDELEAAEVFCGGELIDELKKGTANGR